MGYDGVGNRTQVQWPANTDGTSPYFVTYQFDPLNRMTEIDENGSTATPLAKYRWDVLSRLSLITYGDGTTDAYSQYDAGDNLQTLTQSFAGGQNNVTFTYGWLKNHQRQSTALNNSAFQYIPFTGTTNYGLADANNGYTNAGATNFTYDLNRNLSFDGLNTLTYDVENRLIQAQNAIHGQSQYLYDPLGHRKQKQTNGATTQFVLLGDEEIADFTGTGAGTPQMLTVRGVGGLLVAEIAPAAGASPETVLYYHHDVLGSSVAATSAGQSGAEAFTYGEFGAPGAGYLFTYGFAGYRYDTETGLYYVRARYYSPDLGRFLQTDPIGTAGGANLYAYVGNDPTNLRDPSGKDPLIGAAVGFVAGTIYGGIGAALAPGASLTSILAGAGTGGFVGFAVGLVDPSLGVGTLAVIGGVAGGAGDIAGQVVTNALTGNPLGNINYGSTAGAVIGGAIGGAGGTVLSGLAAKAGISELAGTAMGASLSSGPGTFLPTSGAAMWDYLTGGAEGASSPVLLKSGGATATGQNMK